MAEYDLSFAEKLLEAATFVATEGIEEIDAQRTVLYLSLLASEIALKALLEKAGKPVSQIKKRSHNLTLLLKDLDLCRVQIEITLGHYEAISASRLRAIVVNSQYCNATVGALLDGTEREASKYPNEIRYGNALKHFPAELVLEMASAILAWARKHWDTIRVIIPNKHISEQENHEKALEFLRENRQISKAISESSPGLKWLELVQKSGLRNGYLLKRKEARLFMQLVEEIDQWLSTVGLQGELKLAYGALSAGQRVAITDIVLNLPNPWERKSVSPHYFVNRDLDYYEGSRDGSVPSAYYGSWSKE